MSTAREDLSYQALLERHEQDEDMSFLLEPSIVSPDGCIDPQLTLLNNNRGNGAAQHTPGHSVDAHGSPCSHGICPHSPCATHAWGWSDAIQSAHATGYHTIISHDEWQANAIERNTSAIHVLRDIHPVGHQHTRVLQGLTILHPVDEGIVKLKDDSGHVKYTELKCCAVNCKFGHDQSKPRRKDKLTQHVRDVHQGPNARFQCFVAECDSGDLSLKDLIVHLQAAGLRKDVRFSALITAAEKPKCACGNGLVIRGQCTTCHFMQPEA